MNLSHERFFRILASLKADDGVEVENRQHPRSACRCTVPLAPFENGELGPALAVRLQDLGSGGAALHVFRPMSRGTQLVLQLPENQPAGELEHLRLLTRVAHCKQISEHQYLVGLQFVRVWTSPAPSLDEMTSPQS